MDFKIIAAVLIVFCFFSESAFAKQKQQPLHQMAADDIVAKMKFQLQLSDAQVEKVKGIIENYLAQERQIKLEEKKQLGRVLTGEQMFTWNFLQNEPPREKKKHSVF